MKIGINGFGRIGKALFLQLLLDHPSFEICAINAIHLDIHSIEKYLKYDSVHHYEKCFTFLPLGEDLFEITYQEKKHQVRLIREKDASKIEWNVDLLFEASGAYLTREKCALHRVPFLIITAPAKDKSIPTFVYGVNEKKYDGESIISNASCTTNCIAPLLQSIHRNFSISSASFTTIHATTASQSILDEPSSKSRSSRSIFNNLIPATTGASSAIRAVIPELDGKIHGAAIRVPTNNVSVVDLVIECERPCSKEDLLQKVASEEYYGSVIKIEEEELVSSDFQTTTAPTIIDKPSFLQLANHKVKLLVWYDNEWSYASQTIRMAYVIRDKYAFITPHVSFEKQCVLMRVDYNVPLTMCNGEITIFDDYRIRATLPTLQRILEDCPQRVILATHMGRPKGREKKYSTEILVKHLSSLLPNCPKIHFLPDGISKASLEEIQRIENKYYQYSLCELDEDISPTLFYQYQRPYIYLLENVRFHECETAFEKHDFQKEASEVYRAWNAMGDLFVNCAFGCAHRNHLTINGFESGPTYYDFLIEKELRALREITENPQKKKILAILGGAKIDDKLPLCVALLDKVHHLYLGGGIMNSYIYDTKHRDFIHNTLQKESKDKITFMKDGYGNHDLYQDHSIYKEGYDEEDGLRYFDIGDASLQELYILIDTHDIIFWNGTLGVTEHELYKNGSIQLLNYLLHSKKRVIIGGGDTAGFVNSYMNSNINSNMNEAHCDLHICTGGGASIEFITKNTLVGIKRS